MELLLSIHVLEVKYLFLTVLTAVKVNVIVLCNTHTREMLLSLPAAAMPAAAMPAAPLCCSSATAPLLLQCCTSATGLVM